MSYTFRAQPVAGTPMIDLFVGDMTVPFAQLSAVKTGWDFTSRDGDLVQFIEPILAARGLIDLTGALKIVRDQYIALDQMRIAEQESEIAFENAWLHAAEYDPASLTQMERDDLNGCT